MKTRKKILTVLLSISMVVASFVSAGFVMADEATTDDTSNSVADEGVTVDTVDVEAAGDIATDDTVAAGKDAAADTVDVEDAGDIVIDGTVVADEGVAADTVDVEDAGDIVTDDTVAADEDAVADTVDVEAAGDIAIVEATDVDEIASKKEKNMTEAQRQEENANLNVNDANDVSDANDVNDANDAIYDAGALTYNKEDYNITLSYDADAKIPQGAILSVKEIKENSEAYEAYIAGAAAKVFEAEETEATTLPYARFFDINILSADGEKVEPSAKVKVQIDLKDDALKTESVDFAAVHFIEENASGGAAASAAEDSEAAEYSVAAEDSAAAEDSVAAKDSAADGGTATADTTATELINIIIENEETSEAESVVSFDADSFSVYGVVYYYTVDFYYTPEGDGKTPSEYHMNGGSEMMLTELFEKLGIERNAAEVTEVDFSDVSLVNFAKEGGDWRITSLKPFTTSEELKILFSDGTVINIDVEDATPRNRTPNSDLQVNWNLAADGTLTIKPSNSATSSAFNTNRTTQSAWDSFWATAPNATTYIRGEVTKVVFTKNNNGLGISLNNKQLAYMFSGFTNLKSVEIQDGALTGSAQTIASMFRGCGNLETADLSGLVGGDALYDMQSMFNGCSKLTTVTMNNPDLKTRAGNKGGVNMENMFAGCESLQTVDMSNITLEGRLTNDDWNQCNNLFKGLKKLTTVKLNNTKVPNMRKFQSMFEGCEALTTVEMTGFVPENAVWMTNMFKDCKALRELDLSGFGTLESIINMDGLVDGCTGLETLIIDNLDNSNIAAKNDNHTSGNGRMIFGLESGKGKSIDGDNNLPKLKTISALNSKVWMSENTKGNPGAEYFLAENDNAIYYFTEKKMEFTPAAGSAITIETKRDYIDLITARAESEGRGIDGHSESDKNKSVQNGSSINTNGAGFLAPGVYKILDEVRETPTMEAPLTYYRITEMGKAATTRSVVINEDLGGLLELSGNAIITEEKDRAFWGTGDKVLEKPDGGNYATLATVTYKNAATDINGEKHDVIVEVKRITFKDVELIPNHASATDPYVRRTHDGNAVAGDTYYRTVLEAQSDKISLNNYAYSSSAQGAGSAPISGTRRVLTNGSGTYIDFEIKIKDATDGSSLLFYIDDLDVPHAQSWVHDADDACFDALPWTGVHYGEGSEGMMLGTGNDIDTLSFAEHTGLALLNRNYVVATGSDPATPWSEFYVRANATGASYTWTSGIACDTYILKNTEAPPSPQSVWVMPEAIKYVNNARPGGAYASQYFQFIFKNAEPVKGAEVKGVNYTYNGAARAVIDLNNLAAGETTYSNNNEYITISELEFPVPATDAPEKYIYQIKEKAGTDTQIISYDTDTTHYMQVVVFRPTNDLEMYQGTRAEVIFGTKRGDADIVWDTEDVYAVYSTNAQPELGVYGPNGEQVFKDAQGIRFYRGFDDNKYYNYETASEMSPTTHAKVDRKLTYQGKTYDVKVDKNGVEYFLADDGKYHDANHPERIVVAAREGDIDPETVGNDSPVAVEKKVNGQTVREDVHGVEYYGQYYDLSGNKLTVKDGEFNPLSTDKIVYENATSSTGETIYRHANGQEYFVRGGKYYDANDESKELSLKDAGDVDPLPNDSNAKSNEIQIKPLRETFSGNDYVVRREAAHNIEYYRNEEDNNYYTRYGTLLEVNGITFSPTDSDEVINISREIWVDGSGTRFYKNEGQYYKEADDSHLTALSDGTLDTSEVVDMGSFNNITNVSDITIKKETVDDKAGKFKVHVKFDNGFEPKYVVYEPASSATFSKVDGTEDTWEFTIEDGQRMTIQEVPFNTTYTITEPVTENGWELVSIKNKDGVDSASNIITTKKAAGEAYNKDYEHTLTNRFTEVLVEKKVSKGDKKQKYSFTAEITVSGLNAGDTISYGWLNETAQKYFTASAADDGTGSVKATGTFDFRLADSEDIAIVVPLGAEVKITEADSADIKSTSYSIDGGAETPFGDGAEKKVTLTASQDKRKLVFTNETHVTSITAEKIWDDRDNQDKVRANVDAKFQLYVQTEDKERTPYGDPVTVTTADDFSYTWKDLPVLMDGKPAVYSLEETKTGSAKDDYETDIAYRDSDGAELEAGIPAALKNFSGTITVINTYEPVPGRIEGDETYGGKNETQTGTPDYNVNPNNPVTPMGLIDPNNPDAGPQETVTIPGEGTYTLNEDGTITFKPEVDYVGDPTPITVVGIDKQENHAEGVYTPHVVDNEERASVKRTITYRYNDGTPVAGGDYDKEESVTFSRTGSVDPKTGKITYTDNWEIAYGEANLPAVDSPEVEGWTPDKAKVDSVTLKATDSDIKEVVTYNPEGVTAEPDETYGLPRKTQSGKIIFRIGTKKLPDGTENKITLKLVDPKTGDLADEVTILGQGTYTIKEDGTVEFTPEADFMGNPDPIEVRATDSLGETATTTYTPHIVNPTDRREVTRTVRFTYDTKDGEAVTTELVQKETMVRNATEVDAKTGAALVWGPWEPVTFPAVKNPDEEAKEGYATTDLVEALTITEPQEIPVEYVIYTPASTPEPTPTPEPEPTPEPTPEPKPEPTVTSETKEITRTITYTELTADGKEVSATVVQKVTLTRTVTTDSTTGEVTYGAWEISGDRGYVMSPLKESWTANITSVPYWEIDPEKPESVVINVIYTPNEANPEEKPNTGDRNRPMEWIVLLAIATALSGAISLRRKIR